MFVQERLSQFRNNTSCNPYICSSSKKVTSLHHEAVDNLFIFVESHNRKIVGGSKLNILKFESGDIDMDNCVHKFCVSWFTMQVANAGMQLYIVK